MKPTRPPRPPLDKPALLLLVLAGLIFLVMNVYGETLVVSVSERCEPTRVAGRAGGIDVFAKTGKQILRVEGVCRDDPPVRMWRDGRDRAFVCGPTAVNPLTITSQIQVVKYIRLGAC